MLTSHLSLTLLLTIHLSLSFITINASNDPQTSTLKLLQLVHRHGDRTPIRTYPNDPYSNATLYWPDGWGRLTTHGKSRMYNVGKSLRQRYQNYLSDNPREVHIRSSAAERCLESAAMVMSGAYPPMDRWQWSDGLGKLWQPFPIMTVPRVEDGMLNPGSHCPTAEKELKKLRGSSAVRKYTERYTTILQYVADNTGVNITDIIHAEEIFDVLLIEKENNYKLPIWADDNTYNTLRDISDMTFYFDFDSKVIQRLRAGLILGDLIKHMKDVIGPQMNTSAINKTQNDVIPKLYVHSTHDTLLAVLLQSIGAFNMLAPPFGSSILFELHEISNDHIIRVYYWNVTESDPILLDIPGCSDHSNECHFGDFVHLIQDLIPKNWKSECRLNDEMESTGGNDIPEPIHADFFTKEEL